MPGWDKDFPQVTVVSVYMLWKKGNYMTYRESKRSVIQRKKLGTGIGDLCAAIPGLMGFYPQDSLIIVSFLEKEEGNEEILGPIARCDLNYESIREGGEMIKEMIEPEKIHSIRGIIVTQQAKESEDLSIFTPWKDMTLQIFSDLGVELADLYGSPSLSTDSWWASLREEDMGWISAVEDMQHKIHDSPEELFSSKEELYEDLAERHSPHIWQGWIAGESRGEEGSHEEDHSLLRDIHLFLSWWYDSSSLSTPTITEGRDSKDKLFLMLGQDKDGEKYRLIVQRWILSIPLFPLFFMVSCSPQGKTLRDLWHHLALYSSPALRHRFLLVLAFNWWIIGQGVRGYEALHLSCRSLEESYDYEQILPQKGKTGDYYCWDDLPTLESLGNVYHAGKIREVLKGMSDITLDHLACMLMESMEKEGETELWETVEGIYNHIHWEGLGFSS